jgi:mRNA interferase RelE/StbE
VPYQIDVTPTALRQWRRLPRDVQGCIATAIDALAASPRPHGAVKLAGAATAWRIRVRSYRIIYDVFDDRLLIVVIRVGHRREVYR